MSTAVMMSLGNESMMEPHEGYSGHDLPAQSPHHATVPATLAFHDNDQLDALEAESHTDAAYGIENCLLLGHFEDHGETTVDAKRLSKARRGDTAADKKVIDLPPPPPLTKKELLAEPEVHSPKRPTSDEQSPLSPCRGRRHGGQYLDTKHRACCRAQSLGSRVLRDIPTTVKRVPHKRHYFQMKLNFAPKSLTRAKFIAFLRTILEDDYIVAVRKSPVNKSYFFDVTPEGRDELVRLSGRVYWDDDAHAVLFEAVIPVYSSNTNGVRDFIPIYDCGHPIVCNKPLHFTVLCEKFDIATPTDTVTAAL